MTPNYLRTPKISVSPYCDCSNSGNNKDECDKFTEFFSENTCLREFIYLLFCFFFYSVLLAFTLICSSGFTFLCFLTFLHSAPLVSLLFCSFYPPSFLFLSLPSDQIYPIAMLALLSCCIIAKPVTLHRRAGMCVRLCAHLCVCVCPRAVAELLLQIFDRKRLFHPALLHNGFN